MNLMDFDADTLGNHNFNRGLAPLQGLINLANFNYVSEGGDGYTMLNDGQGVHREVLADILREHIRSVGTITPLVDGRITNLSP